LNQIEKAKIFAKLHIKGKPIVFVNVWDAGSAKAVAALGAKALASASWAVADSHGSVDGENLDPQLVVQNAKRICDAVDLPVSIDLESGYGETADEVGEFTKLIMDAGAIGCNIEDSKPLDHSLRTIEDAAERIAAIRARADAIKLPFFINARTDVFFQPSGRFTAPEAISETARRAAAFKAAGANCLFVPRLTDKALIKEIVAQIDLPLNILLSDNFDKIPEYADLGVSRISMGPNPYRAALATLQKYQSLL